MLQFFLWYIVITILGLLTFPLAYRLLPALADRGYALSRTLGLLVWAFIFWLTVSLGISQNSVGGLLLALMGLVALAVWANWRLDAGRVMVDSSQSEEKRPSTFNLQPVFHWLKTNLRYIASVEILFLVMFAAMAFIRANNPDLTGTEKPMEIAFINAIIHSPTFPPHDPWLSGYAISYYYFGYVMTAMLAEITSTVGSVAFNLMLALIFGLSSIGAYGLVYNLLQAYWASSNRQPVTPTIHHLRSTFGALLAPIFLMVLGNWEAILDVLHKRGVAWTGQPGEVNFWSNFGLGYKLPEGAVPPYNFWTWLNILDLKETPQPVVGGVLERLGFWWGSAGFNGIGRWFSESFMPERGWWWWRASRVVTDYNLIGKWDELIDEFPAFSYVLGDLHPHVLAMPFGLLAGALALNLYLGGWQGITSLFKVKLTNEYEFELNFPVRLEGFLVLALTLGGLAFLNTWDLPIYLGLISCALVLSVVQERGWGWGLIETFLKFAIPLALLSVILYLPFYIGFSSQAGGVAPNVIFATRTTHLWVMFGGLFVPLFAFIVYLRNRENPSWWKGFTLTISFVLLLWAFSTVLAFFAANTPIGQDFISAQGSSSMWDVFRDALLRRLAFGGGLLTLVLLIGGATAYLTAKKDTGSNELSSSQKKEQSPIPFVFLFILFGGMLVLAPEFVYVRDQFGSRMNTVFKFYYEAWALWSIAAVFAMVVMLSEMRRWTANIYAVVVIGLIGVGLLYPVLAFMNKTNDFQSADPSQRTLDGAAYLQRYAPDEYQAMLTLEKAAPGVVVEAIGGSYSDFGRVAIYSGKPNVLGWPGHESQWRGGNKEMGSREGDVEDLYTTRVWDEALAILKKYNVRYVYIGPQERQKYPIYEEKFTQNLSSIYKQGDVVIYLVP